MREIIFGAFFSLFVAIAAFLVAAWPIPGRPVASFFPTGISAAEASAAIGRSGGSLLEFGDTPSLVISIGQQPDYVAELYRSGAWLVANAALARLCMGRS
ncbi:hypothetical protein [Bosea lathyri]|uniref:Uncharacterized protein n=1 Tax=Bosea lathyri TaxID=1036778 RepID=A0A1H5XR38_9HYPH|nr:hypothetical protein [Bosea lathyri]SEG13965.1 hypothetical protein SAMN04488115_103345 [Bosea lathyri]